MLNLLIPCFFSQSPLFLMFLDCVWQLLEQYPAAFEFSEVYLTILYDSARISLFGTFLFNCPHQRVKESTVSRRGCSCLSSRRLQPAPLEITASQLNASCVFFKMSHSVWGKIFRSPGEYNQNVLSGDLCRDSDYSRRKSIEFLCCFFRGKHCYCTLLFVLL